MSNGYIDQALQAGVPIEAIESFLRSNPGDEHRLWSAFDLGRGGVDPLSDRPPATAPYYAVPQLQPSIARMPQPGPGGNLWLPPPLDRDQISALPTMMASDQMGTQGFWGDIGNWFLDLIRGGPQQPGGWQIPGMQLPLPGGAPRPQLPPAGGMPAPRPGGTIVIPPRTGGGGISARKAAAIAAAAAALGMSVEQYLQLYPNAIRSSRRMNVLNPRALRRSIRRVSGFEKFARRTIRLEVTKKFKRRGKRR